MQGSAASGEMANYRKIGRREVESPLPFADLPADTVEMRVKEGSKIRNLMGFALARMELEGTRRIVFSGSGRAVTKTITCAEIMKRRLGGLHQITKLRPRSLRETWQSSTAGSAGALTLLKTVPSVCILLSKEPLDPAEAGYQPPVCGPPLWPEPAVGSRTGPEERGLSPVNRGIKRRSRGSDSSCGGEMVPKLSKGEQASESAPFPGYTYLPNPQQ
ncbi:ribonuclease P protein subunit p25-like protein [Rhincodon typus]|uniref:ribonuclease P protein subunit p25-like protein n=1 Tax=Rhincodon typus TaxID=259920 RepID=UPI0009A26EF0|nr:ribonuclease P protein subunit p25-like protein [Rhincodon typus]